VRNHPSRKHSDVAAGRSSTREHRWPSHDDGAVVLDAGLDTGKGESHRAGPTLTVVGVDSVMSVSVMP